MKNFFLKISIVTIAFLFGCGDDDSTDEIGNIQNLLPGDVLLVKVEFIDPDYPGEVSGYTLEYDDQNLVTKIIFNEQNDSDNNGIIDSDEVYSLEYSLSYNDANQITDVRTSSTSDEGFNIISTYFEYDENGSINLYQETSVEQYKGVREYQVMRTLYTYNNEGDLIATDRKSGYGTTTDEALQNLENPDNQIVDIDNFTYLENNVIRITENSGMEDSKTETYEFDTNLNPIQGNLAYTLIVGGYSLAIRAPDFINANNSASDFINTNNITSRITSSNSENFADMYIYTYNEYGLPLTIKEDEDDNMITLTYQ